MIEVKKTFIAQELGDILLLFLPKTSPRRHATEGADTFENYFCLTVLDV